MGFQQKFWRRLEDEWLKPYCNERRYDIREFKTDAKKITEVDARDFLRAIDNNVDRGYIDSPFSADKPFALAAMHQRH